MTFKLKSSIKQTLTVPSKLLTGGLLLGFMASCSLIPIKRMEILGESMAPTLTVGEFVNIHITRSIERGDIIAFRPPGTLKQAGYWRRDTTFIFRVIGLPGDSVEIRDGQTFINESPLEEESYTQEPSAYEYGPVTVPSNGYFVLGDNRNKAFDSPHWGFVSQNHVIGEIYQ